jgi:dihydropyrimidine dehydrogenase (NAD+) subunit PreT
MCARVCPTEQLCEEACVRMEAEGKPVKIGQLQRYATDTAMAAQKQFFTRAAPTGKAISPWSAPARPALPAPTAWR